MSGFDHGNPGQSSVDGKRLVAAWSKRFHQTSRKTFDMLYHVSDPNLAPVPLLAVSSLAVVGELLSTVGWTAAAGWLAVSGWTLELGAAAAAGSPAC